MCDHHHEYMGVQYAFGRNLRPGSGAVNRYDAHMFYCSKCMNFAAKPIATDRHPSSYETIPPEYTPAADRLLVVPDYDA